MGDSKNTHGGERDNAGRKPKFSEKLEYSIRLTKTEYELIQEYRKNQTK